MNAAAVRKPESTGSPRTAPWHRTTESSNPVSPTTPTSRATDAAYSSSCIRSRQSRPACFCDVSSQRRIRSRSPVCSADHAVASESQRSEATSRSDSSPSQLRRRSGRPDPRQPSMPDHTSSASSGQIARCLAWRTAASRSPCDSNQRAARWWSTGTRVGSSAARSVASCSASRWWQRNLFPPSSRTTSRLWLVQVREDRRRVPALEHRVARLRGELVEHARAQQELRSWESSGSSTSDLRYSPMCVPGPIGTDPIRSVDEPPSRAMARALR